MAQVCTCRGGEYLWKTDKYETYKTIYQHGLINILNSESNLNFLCIQINYTKHELVLTGGDQTSSIPITGHCLLYLGVDGIQVQGYSGAPADTSATKSYSTHSSNIITQQWRITSWRQHKQSSRQVCLYSSLHFTLIDFAVLLLCLKCPFLPLAQSCYATHP